VTDKKPYIEALWIVIQRAFLLSKYIEKKPYMSVVKAYTDD
jgi:hypothetical protein